MQVPSSKQARTVNSWHLWQLNRAFPTISTPYSFRTHRWGKSSWVDQPDPQTRNVGVNMRHSRGKYSPHLYLDPQYDITPILWDGPLAKDWPNNPHQAGFEQLREVAAWSRNQREHAFGATADNEFKHMTQEGGMLYSFPPRDRRPGIVDTLRHTDAYNSPPRNRTLVPATPAPSAGFMGGKVGIPRSGGGRVSVTFGGVRQ